LEENLTMVPPCDCAAEKTAVSAKKTTIDRQFGGRFPPTWTRKLCASI
jgi:hypothetical protein